MSEVKRGALQSPADTARTTDTIVRHVQVIGDDGNPAPSGASISTPVYVSTAEPLEEILLDGVTATGASADQLVQYNKELTIEIVAASVTSGCTAKMEATTDSSNYGNVAVIDKFGTILQTITIAASGTYYYEVVNASSIKYIRANIVTRVDGTYTAKVLGNPI